MPNDWSQVTLAQALEDEARSQTVTLGTEDTREAIRALADKRDPSFRGR